MFKEYKCNIKLAFIKYTSKDIQELLRFTEHYASVAD